MKESIEIFDLVAQAPVEAELVDEVTTEDFLVLRQFARMGSDMYGAFV